MVDYRQNPAARQAYRIVMTIANAPGPFASMTALAQYDVVNPECLPPPKSNPGEHLSSVPTEDVPIALKKVSDTEYVGTLYSDRMLDEDYHGRGLCRWQLIKARIHLKATGTKGETLFIPGIESQKIANMDSETTYFWKGAYPNDPEVDLDEPVDLGQTDRSKMASALSDAELFSVTLTASKEEAP